MPTLTFPTTEHEYAPIFNIKVNYYKGQVVKNAENALFKLKKDLPANTLTEANIDEYVFVFTPKPLPNPSRPMKESIKADTLITSFDSGHEQRRKKSDPKRIFEPQYAVLNHDQYITIRDFFMKVLNSTPFLWKHPIEGVEYLVRFDMDTFTSENFGHSPHTKNGALYKLQLKLLQVWA